MAIEFIDGTPLREENIGLTKYLDAVLDEAFCGTQGASNYRSFGLIVTIKRFYFLFF